jgi:S1-C subfamily serine protease
MRIDGVSKGKPAEKAGFQKGDIVIKLGDKEISDMMSYMKALSNYKNGDKAEVQISRKNKLSIKQVTF